jgi:hypothetical protein
MNLADALATHSYPTGSIIVRQGDPGDGMYFVEEGEIAITMVGGDNVEKHLTSIRNEWTQLPDERKKWETERERERERKWKREREREKEKEKKRKRKRERERERERWFQPTLSMLIVFRVPSVWKTSFSPIYGLHCAKQFKIPTILILIHFLKISN